MINAVRTLMLNRAAASLQETVGSEYVPPEYAPATLSPELTRVHTTIFGTQPDSAGMNIRFRQFAAFLTPPEIDEIVRGLDPRITYLPLSDEIFRASRDLWLEPLVGNPVVIPVVSGELSTGVTGRCRPSWLIRATAQNVVTISPEFPGTLPSVAVGVTFTGSLSQIIPLPGIANLSIRFGGGVVPIDTHVRVSQLLFPPLDVPGVIQAVRHLPAEVQHAVFGVDGPLLRWWQSDLLHLRVPALVLAFAAAVAARKLVGG